MAANTILVLIGALSIAGLGLGAATVSNMPYGGMHSGECRSQGGPASGTGYGNGQCGPANPACDRDGDGLCNGTCDPDRDGDCGMGPGNASCPGSCGGSYNGDGSYRPCH